MALITCDICGEAMEGSSVYTDISTNKSGHKNCLRYSPMNSKDKKFVEFNMNDYIKFKIEEHGRNIWLAYYSIDGVDFKIPECDEEGYHKLQMWCYCKIFGKHMGNGFTNPTNLNVMMQVKDK